MSGFQPATAESLPAAPIQNISGARYKKDGKRNRHETEGMYVAAANEGCRYRECPNGSVPSEDE